MHYLFISFEFTFYFFLTSYFPLYVKSTYQHLCRLMHINPASAFHRGEPPISNRGGDHLNNCNWTVNTGVSSHTKLIVHISQLLLAFSVGAPLFVNRQKNLKSFLKYKDEWQKSVLTNSMLIESLWIFCASSVRVHRTLLR